MAKFKLGDRVRMDPFISGDHDQYVKFRNKVGTIVGVGTYEYDVAFPENPGEAYEFYEEELTRVKSLPPTDTKSLRAKYSKSFGGPLKTVLTTLLVKYGIAASSSVEYFPGDSGGYKITVQRRSDVDKAERLREEVEREFGIPVYVAF